LKNWQLTRSSCGVFHEHSLQILQLLTIACDDANWVAAGRSELS